MPSRTGNRIAAIIALVLMLGAPCASASWVDTGNHIKWGATAVTAVSGTFTVTAGNLVTVGVCSNRTGGPQPSLTVTDSNTNTWTNEGVQYTDPQGASISWSKITTGGAITITVSGNGSNSYSLTPFAREFQNPNSSPSSGSPVGSTATSANMDTTAVTPADNDVLVVAVGCPASSGTITENQSPGDTGWTLSDEDEAATNTPGSFVFKIITGAPGTPRAAWTNTSSVWTTRIKALKPAAGVTCTPSMLLLRVGRCG